jgi:hypothetical protein
LTGDLAGWVGLLLGMIGTLLLSMRYPQILPVLVVAFLSRAGAVLFHYYVAPLPDGAEGDAISFEAKAYDYLVHGPYQRPHSSLDGISPHQFYGESFVPKHETLGACVYTGLPRSECGIWMHNPGPNSKFYPWVMSLVYAVTGRSFLALQSISVFLGVSAVFLTWRIGRIIWGPREGRRAAWVVALFPTMILYSALPLREPFVVFFLLAALLWITRWVVEGGVKTAFLAFLLLGFGVFFHGSLFVVAFTFFLVITGRLLMQWSTSLLSGRLYLPAFFGLIVVGGIIAFWAISGTQIDKLGTISDLFDLDRWIRYSQQKYYADGHGIQIGNAVYPSWTQPQVVIDLVWVVPLKVAYLLFAPFPWDVRALRHLIGIADGLMYTMLFLICVRSWKTIWQNPQARVILIIIVPFLVAFAIGTSNFGTGLRHRAKALAVLALLASPWLSRISLRSKRKKE